MRFVIVIVYRASTDASKICAMVSVCRPDESILLAHNSALLIDFSLLLSFNSVDDRQNPDATQQVISLLN